MKKCLCWKDSLEEKSFKDGRVTQAKRKDLT